MRRVIVESPYQGNINRNTSYARAAMHDCLMRGEAPFVPHLLYTQPNVLNDSVVVDRAIGLAASRAWCGVADATVVYCDFGITEGMQDGMDRADEDGRPVERRSILY